MLNKLFAALVAFAFVSVVQADNTQEEAEAKAKIEEKQPEDKKEEEKK